MLFRQWLSVPWVQAGYDPYGITASVDQHMATKKHLLHCLAAAAMADSLQSFAAARGKPSGVRRRESALGCEIIEKTDRLIGLAKSWLQVKPLNARDRSKPTARLL
jgi:hypothetical protein